MYQTTGLKMLGAGTIAIQPASISSSSVLGSVGLLIGSEFGVGPQ